MMYPKFIEVHDIRDDSPIAVNVENITNFHVNEDAETVIEMNSQEFYLVKESYDDLQKLIVDCGCYINKGDPRLDTEHPLTMDDLMTMVGEPVWNSNNGEWGLVTKDPVWHDETHPDWKRQSGYYLRYHDDTITRFDEEDLKKFPLYRTKR